MPSLLGLHLSRFDPFTCKPAKGWCNDVPLDETEEWEESIRHQGSLTSINNQYEDTESIDTLESEVATEQAIEDEIYKVQERHHFCAKTRVARKVAQKAPIRQSAKDAAKVAEDDFDDEMIFALTPETCPGPPLTAKLRIFVATWNMAAEDPFAQRRRGQYIGDNLAAEKLRELLPLGYDIYVIGTQEQTTKHLHAAVLARLHDRTGRFAQKYQRLALAPKRREAESSDLENSRDPTSFCASCSANCDSLCIDEFANSPTFVTTTVTTDSTLGCSWWRKEREEEEIRGHGDHALLRRKSTGLSVYYAHHLHGRIEAIGAGSHKFTGSKGGVGVTIQIAGNPETLTFVNCHLEANRIERRRRQLNKLAQELPRSLQFGSKTTLNNCSDHVIWMGDFNYRIQCLDGDEVLQLLSAGRLQELHDHYDSMSEDLDHVLGLQNFREPEKWPTFYPTYKKVARRARLPLSGSTTGTGRDTQWAQHVYQTTFREPFYKGGRVRERVPGWCDRILYCSKAQNSSLKVEQAACSDASRGSSSFNAQAVRDNYRSLNDELRGSDHSPVTCTFLWAVKQ